MDVLHQIISGTTRIGVGHHPDSHVYLDSHLTQEEKEIISPLSPRKRTEWLASRELLYKIAKLPERISCVYDDFGKPVLLGSPKHISVSHSELWCAAMISDQACGVDIQTYTHTVRRIAERFLTGAEIQDAKAHAQYERHLHVLWGAKECMYKAYGKRKLGFRENIRVDITEPELGKGRGEIFYDQVLLRYEIYYRMLPEVVWVYCLEQPVHPERAATGL